MLSSNKSHLIYNINNTLIRFPITTCNPKGICNNHHPKWNQIFRLRRHNYSQTYYHGNLLDYSQLNITSLYPCTQPASKSLRTTQYKQSNTQSCATNTHTTTLTNFHRFISQPRPKVYHKITHTKQNSVVGVENQKMSMKEMRSRRIKSVQYDYKLNQLYKALPLPPESRNNLISKTFLKKNRDDMKKLNTLMWGESNDIRLPSGALVSAMN